MAYPPAPVGRADRDLPAELLADMHHRLAYGSSAKELQEDQHDEGGHDMYEGRIGETGGCGGVCGCGGAEPW
ncbi:hypothetical protein HTV45_06480 [Streptomyces sp. CHD11]|uniref:hypothetical protein n=1 Tax=Streptomyces sp. CHD11 TaxID=2741325 RepID=UPI001BFC8D80|nr:hypothetical protein [Streptomyces sp. CHD11]MBT3150535.1 hypothetical protein [Streptomyces sp. CHD11]